MMITILESIFGFIVGVAVASTAINLFYLRPIAVHLKNIENQLYFMRNDMIERNRQ